MDSTRTVDDNKPKGVEGKVYIIAKEKTQTSTMRSTMYPSKNRTPITLDKTNKLLILISFQLTISLFIKTYNLERKNK